MTPIDNLSFDEENMPRDTGNRQLSSPPYSPPFSGTSEDDGRSIQDARDYLRAGADSDSQLSEESSVERTRQQAVLIELSKRPGWLVPDDAVQALNILSNSTSEHEVRYRASGTSVLKITWPGCYGQVPVIRGGKLQRALATPAQYLDRLDLHNIVFGGQIKLEGIHVSDRPSLVIGESPGQPSLVVSQQLYQSADPEHPAPSDTEMSVFMRAQGFLPVRGSYFGWIRPSDGIAVTDAKPDNFMLTAHGIVPIDLQLAQLDPVLLRQMVVE